MIFTLQDRKDCISIVEYQACTLINLGLGCGLELSRSHIGCAYISRPEAVLLRETQSDVLSLIEAWYCRRQIHFQIYLFQLIRREMPLPKQEYVSDIWKDGIFGSISSPFLQTLYDLN